MMTPQFLVFEENEHTIIFFGNEHIESVLEIQSMTDRDKLVLVNLEPIENQDLHPDRFLIENFKHPIINHLLWRGLFDASEQRAYLLEKARLFISSNTRLYIEEYEFEEDEVFYDYSK